MVLLGAMCGFALGAVISGVGFYIRQEALIQELRERVEGRCGMLPPKEAEAEATA